MSTDHTPIWQPVRAFVRARLAGIGRVPTVGTNEWCQLADDDPRKAAAIYVAASRWALEQELDRFHYRAHEAKQAAIEISQAAPWAAVAQRIAQRDAWNRAHPDLIRKAS